MKMRVVMLTLRWGAISETFILRQARRLNVTVYTMSIEGNRAEPTGLTVVELPKPQHELGLLRRRGRALFNIVAHQNAYDMPPITKRALADRLSGDRPDVVLAQYGPMGLLALATCDRLGIPLVVHFHGYDVSSKLKSWYRLSLWAALKRFSGVIVVNDAQEARP